VAGAGLLAGALAAPQVLPALELSRVSHRAAPPSPGGYRAYNANALPPRNLVTLLAPDFFGDPDVGTYWNANDAGVPVNYAEWALYVGVLPLVLTVYCLAAPRRREGAPPPPAERFFFAGVALLALLMAAGTPINLPFFFGVPGFAQTGSPARALLLFAFSVAVLAAIGLDRLRSAPGSRGGGRAVLVAFAVPLLLAAIGASLAARFAHESVPVPLGELLAPTVPHLWRVGALAVLAAGTLVLARRGSRSRRFAAAGCVALVFLDLATWGVGYNRTAPPEAVYPVTPGIRWLQANARGALIAPLNRDWSLGPAPPRAVLPPNALTVYGLHDVGGYDSLLPRRAKQRVQDAGNGEDPSPPENGNIVFVKSIGAARGLGARFLVAAPEAAEAWERRAEEAGGGTAGPLRRVYGGEDLVIFEDPEGRDWRPPADVIPGGTGAFRLGLFLGLAGVAALSAAATGAAFGFRRRLGRPS
jgi:hypothetical protein